MTLLRETADKVRDLIDTQINLQHTISKIEADLATAKSELDGTQRAIWNAVAAEAKYRPVYLKSGHNLYRLAASPSAPYYTVEPVTIQ